MSLLRTISRAASAMTYPLQVDDILGLVNPAFSVRQLHAIVLGVDAEGPRAATIRFRPGPGWRGHQAGQWVRVGVEIDGVRHWRSYSLSSAPGQTPSITVTAKGLVSTELVRRIKPGDVLHLGDPQGDFVLPERTRPLLFIAGGSGMSPIMSMIRTALGRGTADVVLIQTAHAPEDDIFAAELAGLSASPSGLRVVHWYSGSQGRLDCGRPDTIESLCPDWRSRAAYACGPEGLVADAERLWTSVGATLTVERFAVARVQGPPGDDGTVTFTRSDKRLDVSGDTSLLEAGESVGVPLPNGCRMGICRTCLTRLDAGSVRDLTNGVVHGEPGDLIRTCVSAPAGDVRLDA